MLSRRGALLAALAPLLPTEASTMQVRRGARSFDAVRVPDPIDPIEVSLALPTVALQLVAGRLEISSGTDRCWAGPGQWVVLDRRTGALRAVDDDGYARQFAACQP